MITLDDTLNRNYYFYQGSGEVREDFLKAVFNLYLGYDFNTFTIERTKMWLKKGLNSTDAKTKALHQGVETALRACGAIRKYRAEIIKKFNEEPSLRGGITDERVNKMRYNELSTLRTNLGLNKRGKKVVKTEPAPEKTVAKAKKVLQETSTAKTAVDVVSTNSQLTIKDFIEETIEPHHEIEEFYTVEEAMQAYPGYTYRELQEAGIHLIEPEQTASEKIDRYTIIEEILEFNISIGGKELTIESLANCSKQELLEIYNTARIINRVTKGHTK